MSWIYVLKLKKGKYYVGRTNNPKARLTQHTNKAGSAWTRKYPVVRRVELLASHSAFDENNMTKWYMCTKGIDNVRGGAYCQIDLDPLARGFLEHEFLSLDDSCYRCRKPGHFEFACPQQATPLPFLEPPESSSEESEENSCVRCGREGHCKRECYAVRDISGRYIVDEGEEQNNFDSGCGRCGRDTHVKKDCYAKTDIDGNQLFEESSSEEEMEIETVCERCGREGHERTGCYAKIDIRGRWISDKPKTSKSKTTKKPEKATSAAPKQSAASKQSTSAAPSRNPTGLTRSQSDLRSQPQPTLNRSHSGGQPQFSKTERKREAERDDEGPNKRLKGSGGAKTPPDTCGRCGRGGHAQDRCYAKTDVNGQFIR